MVDDLTFLEGLFSLETDPYNLARKREMKTLLSVLTFISLMGFGSSAFANPTSAHTTGYSTSDNKVSAYSNNTTSRTGDAGVGGRHSVGTSASINVNGIHVGAGTSISADRFGSSTATSSTGAVCSSGGSKVSQSAFSGVYGKGGGSASASSGAGCK
jgi:hypothetical protein